MINIIISNSDETIWLRRISFCLISVNFSLLHFFIIKWSIIFEFETPDFKVSFALVTLMQPLLVLVSTDRIVPSAAEKLEKKKTVQLDASTVEIEERGVKLRLTVVDTPGFGDAIDNTDSFQQIIRYIDDQFERWFVFSTWILIIYCSMLVVLNLF